MNDTETMNFFDTIKTELTNSYIFILQYKECFLILVILVLFYHFGFSQRSLYNKYSKKQNGGSNVPSPAPAQRPLNFENMNMNPSQSNGMSKKEQKAQRKAEKKASKNEYRQMVKAHAQEDNETRANLKRIGFFEGIKNKFGKGSKIGGQYGALGPVFGNMDKIMSSVGTVFYIVAIILTIVGILSIPVLILLIITYLVFKALVSKFTHL